MLGATSSQEVNPRYLPKLTALLIVQHTDETVRLAGVAEPGRELGMSRIALFQ